MFAIGYRRFFEEGPKVLFQFALAALKINGEQILKAKDDGEIMNIFKNYYSHVHESWNS